jgi:N utilization substance protein B
MQALFAYSCGNEGPSTPDSIEIISKITEIDSVITQAAPKWPLAKINQVDLAILRCSIWELIFQKKAPTKVVIDEAVELAKEFGTDSSSSFVNGCLGGYISQL